MSAPEAVQPPPKPEVRQKPPLRSKPSNGTPDAPAVESVNTDVPVRNSGNVLKIASKFNHPDVQPPSGTSAPENSDSKKKDKTGPTVKPRPWAAGSAPTQAPPLPSKRRHAQKKKEEPEEDAQDVTDGKRSAPDGKEVEVEVQSGRLMPEQELISLAEPQCERSCSCVCHLQRPGMKLVWVSITEQDLEAEQNQEAEQDNESRPDEDQKSVCGGDEAENHEAENHEVENRESDSNQSQASACVDDEIDHEASVLKKEKFKATLNLIEGKLRRSSDPGPAQLLNSINLQPQVTPNITKAYSAEEESIYEAVIHNYNPCKDVTPVIQITKPPRPPKDTTDGSPPAIPPREPRDKIRGPWSPWPVLPPPSGHSLSPKMASGENSPPDSPPTHRPPPRPPTKANGKGRRFSSQSQSIKDDDEGSSGGDAEKEDKKPAVGLTRQKSLDMEAQMQEEPLYQVYNKAFITKEIRRQTVCRNTSKTSVDLQTDPRITFSSGTEGSRSSPIPSVKQNTLWQDLPAVRESGILQNLKPEECKYQESMFEVMTSEVSYLRSLRVLTEHFLESRELNDTLILLDKKTLFSNILRIQEVSERFLKDLEARLDEGLLITDICDIISYHAQHNFPAYIDYVRNQIYQEKTYSGLMQSNVQFAAVITRLQEAPVCQRLPFISFLLLPFQRITRIKMLVENILKRTAEGTEKEESASKALEAVSKIIEECNTQVGKMKQVEELIEINRTLEFDKLKAVPIISRTRFLEKRGELLEMVKGGTLFNLKPKFTPVFLFLFNDLLVIASKKGSERYVVLDHAHRSLVQVQTLAEDTPSPNMENCFCLTLLENHQGRLMERLLKAPSQSDMHRWLAAFPNPEDPNREQEEVIYEDWDCPQVQCAEKYVAKQTDELNLEPPEIINVIRKTNEGWYEGIRLSDGQKGWFPVANVLEITNEHVRRRNLRERYRVMRAASAVTHKSRTLS